MRTYSYSGCEKCLVKANCSHVCDQYKRSLKRKYKIDVSCDAPLEQVERCLERSGFKEVADKLVSPKVRYIEAMNVCFIEETYDFDETTQL